MLENQFEVIERAVSARGEIQLQRRGSDYEIISNGTFLMATYNGESEKILVKAAIEACERRDGRQLSALIGGLGVGYSLAEALRSERVRHVTVVELEPKVIEWNRSYLAPFSGWALDNDKTEVVRADLIPWVAQSRDIYDVICLDIDNGPDWTVYGENGSLYGDDGLAALARLLHPGGIISFWSAASAPVFAERLKTRFRQVREIAIEQQDGVAPDFVYIAVKE